MFTGPWSLPTAALIYRDSISKAAHKEANVSLSLTCVVLSCLSYSWENFCQQNVHKSQIPTILPLGLMLTVFSQSLPMYLCAA
jgi:hypothetical protein